MPGMSDFGVAPLTGYRLPARPRPPTGHEKPGGAASGPLLLHEQAAPSGGGRLPIRSKLGRVAVLAQPDSDVVLVVYTLNDDVTNTTVILSLQRGTNTDRFRHELSLKHAERGEDFQIVVLTQPLNP